MRSGIFYEHQIPRPWSERSEYEVFQNWLAQIELAEVDTEAHTVYAHQNEDIIRLTPEELKRKMAEKEAASRPHA